MQEKKILVLSNNLSRASFRQRIGNYLPFLKEAGIQADVQQLPRKQILRWKLFKSAQSFDAVLLHKKRPNFLDACVLRRYSKIIIYDFDDAIMYSPARPDSDHTSHMRLFKRTVRLVDCVIAGNDYLAEHARRFCSNVHVLPTGLDTKPYTENLPPKQPDKLRLVWIGSQSTLKYLKELKPALEIVGKKNKSVILRIIADVFFDLDNMPVEKITWSLQSQEKELSCGDIGLAPLPDNRFSRGKCGFKILQYYSAGLPVIASPVGVNVNFVKDSNAGMLAQTPEEWIEEILTLVDNRLLREKMGHAGKRYVQYFDTTVIGKKFCDIIQKEVSR